MWSCKRAYVFLAIGCLVLTGLLTAAQATYLKPVFDDIFIGHQKERLFYVAFLIFSVSSLKGLFEYGSSLCMDYLGQNLVHSLQQAVFKSLIKKDVSFFHDHHEAGLSAVFLGDIKTLRLSVVNVLTSMVQHSLTVLALTYVMLRENMTLWFAALFALPFIALILMWCGRKVRALSSLLLMQNDRVVIFFQQIIQNIVLIKAYHTEEKEIARLQNHLDGLRINTMKTARVRSMTHPMMETLSGFAIMGVVIIGGLQVIDGVKTTGSFVTFIMSLIFSYRPLKLMISLNAQLQEGVAAAARIQKILLSSENSSENQGDDSFIHQSVEEGRQPIEAFLSISPITDYLRTDGLKKGLTFQDVSFRYTKNRPWVFNCFSCHFPAQARIALVGGSGVGKSTLFQLLLQFYTPEKGNILWDGVPIHTLPLPFLRQCITYVGQDALLFDDTIEANIAYGVSATQEQVIKAAQMAHIDAFVQGLPLGYQTSVGTRGVHLSGGQRQRIALARAFLRDSPLLLMDEATSALDAESEHDIQMAIRGLTQSRTSLTIAHRFSTIEHADIIYVLQSKGTGAHVIQQGTHRSLLSQDGLYKTLALHQIIT